MGGFENEAHNIGGLTEENYGYIRVVVKCEEQLHIRYFPKKFSEVGTTPEKRPTDHQRQSARYTYVLDSNVLESRLAYTLPFLSTSWFLSSLAGKFPWQYFEIGHYSLVFNLSSKDWGQAVTKLVEALRYKPEGRGSDSRWCHWNFSLT
jgi:hypothetical protein